MKKKQWVETQKLIDSYPYNDVNKSKTITTIDIELAMAFSLDFRRQLIVPNIHWGAGVHECDLFVLTKAGYATEIEIKISKADLIKDKEKRHQHRNKKIKQLYFAIPEHLVPHIHHIPQRAGIYIVFYTYSKWPHRQHPHVMCIRNATIEKGIIDFKFGDKERFNIARLGALRIWGLKTKIRKLQLQVKELKNEKQTIYQVEKENRANSH